MPQNPLPLSGTTEPAGRQLAAPPAFPDSPLPTFLTGADSIVRRLHGHGLHRQAGAVLGLPVQYAKGKLFAALVAHQARAVQAKVAVQAQVAAAQAQVAQASPAPAPEPPRPALGPDAAIAVREADAMAAVREATARGDVLSAATLLVLRNTTTSTAALVRRSAKLLAGELDAWVMIDLERQFRLRRQYVAAPRGGQSALAKSLAGLDPEPGSVPCDVHQSGSTFLVAHAEDTGLLGADGSGRPVLSRLGASSVLTVPLSDGESCYGTLTLAREAAGCYFGLADAGLAEQIGECIALGIRAQRTPAAGQGGVRCRARRAAVRRGAQRLGGLRRRARATGHPLEPRRW